MLQLREVWASCEGIQPSVGKLNPSKDIPPAHAIKSRYGQPDEDSGKRGCEEILKAVTTGAEVKKKKKKKKKKKREYISGDYEILFQPDKAVFRPTIDNGAEGCS